jgi:3-deoxy-manno-octulosonate cytidylyltransferase (CMP-KDO synthetase)
MTNNKVILIPSRLGSTRLERKPLADIGGKPMVVRVVEQAIAANVADVWVAAGEQEIVDVVEKFGYQAILTDPALPSGTDRVWQGYQKLGKEYQYIMNLQGDMPNIGAETIRAAFAAIEAMPTDISTAATLIDEADKVADINVVKAVIATGVNATASVRRALYFTRATCPFGSEELYEHLGLYVYKAEALAKFVALPQSPLEKCERLEQLRALENGMSISVALVDDKPVSVDTQKDLDRARQSIEG